MARKPGVWFRKQTGWYMTTVGGEQVKLSRDKKEAEKAFHQLMADRPAESAEDGGPRPSLRHLVGLYLDEAKATKGAETYQVQRRYLVGFCEFVGNKKAPDVRVPHVKDWLAAHLKWGPSTRALAISTLIALFNWAVTEQRLAASPIKGVKRGKFKRREQIIPPDHRAKIFAACGPELKDFLTLCSLTGARPFSELGRLTAEKVDFANGLIPLPEHKTAKKTNRPRIIVLVPEALAILRRLADKHPTGLLLRSPKIGQWRRQVVSRALKRAAARAGVPGYLPYDLRRTFITEGLAKGLSANMMAQLAGNSPQIISKFYDSLHLRIDALKAAAAKVVETDRPRREGGA
ncbi:MAG: tyrosine-type recombinase/integrase [Gemmataceae bacterium]